jgi:hypothetical protein
MSTIKNREEWAKAVAEELPTICDGFERLRYIPAGWHDVVYAALTKIEEVAVANNLKTKVAQIKEKDGGLAFYVDNSTSEVDTIVEKAVTSCYHTCEKCGKYGMIRSDIGWYQTLCEDHYMVQKRKDPIWRAEQEWKNK